MTGIFGRCNFGASESTPQVNGGTRTSPPSHWLELCRFVGDVADQVWTGDDAASKAVTLCESWGRYKWDERDELCWFE